MTTFLTNLVTTARALWNKGLITIILILLMVAYLALNSGEPSPFAELLYACILIAGVFTVAPLLRVLFFPEAAEYAESGRLRKDLDAAIHSPALIHYRYATAICFAVPASVIPFLL